MLEMIHRRPTCWPGMWKYRLQWSGREGREWSSTRWTQRTSHLSRSPEIKLFLKTGHLWRFALTPPIRADFLEEFYWQSLHKILRGCGIKRRSGQIFRPYSHTYMYVCMSSLDNMSNWYLHSLKNSHPKVKEDDTVHGGTGAILLSIS